MVRQRINLNRILLFFVWIGVIIFFIYISSINLMRLRGIELQKAEIQQKIDNQIQVAEDMNKEMQYQETDEFIEKIARQKLGLVMPDEIVFIQQ